jgi:hypothetical protein
VKFFDPQRRRSTQGDDFIVGPPIAWFTDPAGNILSVLQAD